MSLRILEAIFKKDGLEKIVTLSDLADKVYESSCKGYLFCPNSNCSARIVFVRGEKRPHFRTWKSIIVDGNIVDEHIQGCSYFVEHQPEVRVLRRSDPNLYTNLSEKHIQNVLDNANDRQFNPEKFNRSTKGIEGTKKRPSTKSRTDNSLDPKGRVGLGINGADTAEKEPRVYRKSINDISELDYTSVQCVDGYAENMAIDSEFPYINLLTNNGKKARILFSEAFTVNNRAEFNNIQVYKEYIELMKSNGIIPFVVCIGKITKDEYEISIVIENYRMLSIDRKGHYRILKEMNNVV